MKTSEFKEAVEELGFAIKLGHENFVLNKEADYTGDVASVSRNKEFLIDTDLYGFSTLPKSKRRKILDLLFEYASTPINEREPENRYHLKLMAPILTDDEYCFLNKKANEKNYLINNKKEALGYKTIFTESELETMDLTGFEKVEVME